jgi:tRNA dimethylallyltransferase
VKSPSESTSAAYVLVGPTAVGKSAVGHQVARDQGLAILSADSMQVYRGMDIGTAKPSRAERSEVTYHGLDLVDPDQPFSAGMYLEHALGVFAGADKPLVVTGGTGLYVKALIEGLDAPPPADDRVRAESARLLAHGGVEALRDRVRRECAAHYAAVSDTANPRRLVRAWELAVAGAAVPARTGAVPRPVVVGLNMERGALRKVIEDRVRAMFREGLVEELRGLRERYGELSETAAQAIGYKEAAEYADGSCSLEDAVQRVSVRTGQLAKRQMTWFRRQAEVAWVDLEPGTPPDRVASMVCKLWEEHGHVLLDHR